jgi:hypothetical protein
MRPASSSTAALLVAALLAYANSISAGPVQLSESDGRAEGAIEASATLPALSGAAPSHAAIAAEPAASGNIDAARSNSALAVEIIKEADAGALASDQPRNTQRTNTHSAAQPKAPNSLARSQERAAEDEWGLREAGKAAVHWIKETVPWLRSDADEKSATPHGALDSTDWTGSPLDGGPAGRGARGSGSTQMPGTAGGPPVDPASIVGYGSAERPKAVDPDQNLVRAVVSVIREVLVHPMTWLMVALVIIGGIVVKAIDRRPTK